MAVGVGSLLKEAAGVEDRHRVAEAEREGWAEEEAEGGGEGEAL